MTDRELIEQLVARIGMLEDVVYEKPEGLDCDGSKNTKIEAIVICCHHLFGVYKNFNGADIVKKSMSGNEMEKTMIDGALRGYFGTACVDDSEIDNALRLYDDSEASLMLCYHPRSNGFHFSKRSL